MKRMVGAKAIIEGFHNFPQAVEMFGKEIDFLEVRHRHNFGIVVEVAVSHNERDKEFILLQREIKEVIKNKFGSPAEFGAMSCESIAELLINHFDAVSVTVDEDGENFSKICR